MQNTKITKIGLHYKLMKCCT